jgi:site-specific DNA-methyltransferase (adenine-specific)
MIMIPELNRIYLGDCIETMKTWPDNCIDAIVTDPPYGIRFMGKAWDGEDIDAVMERKKRKGTVRSDGFKINDGKAFAAGTYDLAPDAMRNFQEWTSLWAAEALRVLKPGGHLLSFASARTYHRMASGIEDAGFEIRDQIQWIFGSGFPKSQNISKMMDKKAGAERAVVGKYQPPGMDKPWNLNNAKDERGVEVFASSRNNLDVTAPSTDDAKTWDGWGTALKPASEPICVARKPLSEKTVVANVLKWGTGAMNIDACRLDRQDGDRTEYGRDRTLPDPKISNSLGKFKENTPYDSTVGRWPSNVILDEEAGRLLDEQSGGASRFFYCAKPSTAERERGTEERERKPLAQGNQAQAEVKRGNLKHGGDSGMNTVKMRGNIHPTVKPIDLMAYLIKLVAPPGGTVLDPFLGSGTTAIAAETLMVKWVGIEMNPEYAAIAEARIAAETAQGKLI